MAGAEAGTKATIAALFANAGIAISRFVAYVFTGSASRVEARVRERVPAARALDIEPDVRGTTFWNEQ